jgi:hypothetical protein
MKVSIVFRLKFDDNLGCQGTGIYLIHSADQLQSKHDKMLIQEYVDDPYLLPDNLKFDFRVYAVIRSINPLSIYIAREGKIFYLIIKNFVFKKSVS